MRKAGKETFSKIGHGCATGSISAIQDYSRLIQGKQDILQTSLILWRFRDKCHASSKSKTGNFKSVSSAYGWLSEINSRYPLLSTLEGSRSSVQLSVACLSVTTLRPLRPPMPPLNQPLIPLSSLTYPVPKPVSQRLAKNISVSKWKSGVFLQPACCFSQ